MDIVNALFTNAIMGGGGGVAPSGTLSISANGTYDVASFASAAVYVSGSGPTLTDYIDGNISGVFSDPAVSIIRGGAFIA